ncbi:MAG: hypothetical protein ACOYI2_08060 [Bacillota bacterium]|nr:hypothetical protein [Clostridia bacterium]
MAGLEALEGKVVRVHRGGPKSRTGLLLGVRKDYLVMWNDEDGIQYLARNHVQSICEDKKGNFNFALEEVVYPAYVDADTLVDCLRKLEYQWVRVNDGPEGVEGIIVDVEDDYIKIISDQEVRIMYLYHLKNVSPGPKPEKKSDVREQSAEEQGENSGRDKQHGDKQQGDKQGDKQQGSKQQGDKQQENKQQEEKKQDEKKNDDKHAENKESEHRGPGGNQHNEKENREDVKDKEKNKNE